MLVKLSPFLPLLLLESRGVMALQCDLVDHLVLVAGFKPWSGAMCPPLPSRGSHSRDVMPASLSSLQVCSVLMSGDLRVLISPMIAGLCRGLLSLMGAAKFALAASIPVGIRQGAVSLREQHWWIVRAALRHTTGFVVVVRVLRRARPSQGRACRASVAHQHGYGCRIYPKGEDAAVLSAG